MAGDFVNLTLWCWADTKNSRGTTRDLCAASIMNDLRADAKADCLGLEHEHFILAVDFQGDFGLSQPLPLSEDGMRGVGANETLVAG